jgi:hypothetical protein
MLNTDHMDASFTRVKEVITLKIRK